MFITYQATQWLQKISGASAPTVVDRKSNNVTVDFSGLAPIVREIPVPQMMTLTPTMVDITMGCFYAFFFLYTFGVFLLGLAALFPKLGIMRFLINSLSLVEQEISAIKDSSMFWIVLTGFVMYHFYGYYVSGSVEIWWLITTFFLLLLVIGVFLFPCFVMWNQGFFFLPYITGSATRTSLLFEGIMDYIGILAYFLRINIQLIRFLIVAGTFLMYNEMYLTFAKTQLYATTNVSLETYTDYLYYGLAMFWTTFARLMFEVAHFWVLFFIQGTTFSVVLVVLMQFLYSAFIFTKMAAYFKKRKTTVK